MDFQERIANAVFDILVEQAGMPEFDRLTFVWRFCSTDCNEFALPFRTGRNPTPTLRYLRQPRGVGIVHGCSRGVRIAQIDRTNDALRKLSRSIVHMSPLERREWTEVSS